MYYKVYNLKEAYELLPVLWQERRKWNKEYGNTDDVYNVLIKSLINTIRLITIKNKFPDSDKIKTFRSPDNMYICEVNGENIGLGINKIEALKHAYQYKYS